ncbi:MAG: hypothetical protein CM1200mP30_20660 [Pseudomonadota bacterium]|nr:MAG: hypothetical protein CM1200mP30_20660 [Pseudomonadota bacterium]
MGSGIIEAFAEMFLGWDFKKMVDKRLFPKRVKNCHEDRTFSYILMMENSTFTSLKMMSGHSTG